MWFDEIYIGPDTLMDFKCPVLTKGGTHTSTTPSPTWSQQEVNDSWTSDSTYNKMTRHYSHLDTLGPIPFDGQGALNQNLDVSTSAHSPYGERTTKNNLPAGSLTYVQNGARAGMYDTLSIWVLISMFQSNVQDEHGTQKRTTHVRYKNMYVIKTCIL